MRNSGDDTNACHASTSGSGAGILTVFVEVALKARIGKTLSWTEYPATRGEFQSYANFKTHDLDVLLHLSGMEAAVKAKCLAEWSTVAQWDPEVRYRSIGSATAQDAQSMVDAVRALLGAL
jgi:hypothetical protein